MVYNEQQSIIRLRWRWLIITLIYGVALFAGYWSILQQWQSNLAMRWLSLASAMMVVHIAILWWALDQNRRAPNAMLLPFLGYANAMTVTRGLLTCLLAGFLFAPRPTEWLAWVPAILYTLERLLDYFDGYVARITHHETKLGVILDMEFDSLGFLIAVTLAIQYGQLPPWYIVLGLARFLFIGGLWLRSQRGLPNYPLPPTEQGRLIAGLQTSFASVVLWPAIAPQITQIAAYLFAIPLVYSFGRDWLVVSAVVDAQSSRYLAWRRGVKQVFEQWLPLASRLVAGALALRLVWWPPGTAEVELTGMALFWTVMALPVILGIVGRAAALALTILAGQLLMAHGLDWASNGLLLVCSLIVVHLGSGALALWQPEEYLLRKKLGQPATAQAKRER
jgi:CDP-diacylglycerol--glycerol-3-phosphate 3-phosphatidyltransferase